MVDRVVLEVDFFQLSREVFEPKLTTCSPTASASGAWRLGVPPFWVPLSRHYTFYSLGAVLSRFPERVDSVTCSKVPSFYHLLEGATFFLQRFLFSNEGAREARGRLEKSSREHVHLRNCAVGTFREKGTS